MVLLLYRCRNGSGCAVHGVRIKVASVAVAENPDLLPQLRVTGIPAARFLRDGKAVDTLNAADPEALKTKVEAFVDAQGRMSL
jgi:thioredoxin-like negative regulator of GroEL